MSTIRTFIIVTFTFTISAILTFFMIALAFAMAAIFTFFLIAFAFAMAAIFTFFISFIHTQFCILLFTKHTLFYEYGVYWLG
ncbi:hypothetical protein ACIGC1_14855 [Peribacillus butanolivorans]|uniref:hypothetical protein n=1 Tax=Peribacillus butanolivorans TaxID=421767 RepID=UPI0037C5CB60